MQPDGDQRDLTSLRDILGFAVQIGGFVDGFDAERFARDDRTQLAVSHAFLLFGEATKRLSNEFKQRHSAIPWKSMAGMRDHLAHAYDAVDLDEVWRTAVEDIPRLRAGIEKILSVELGRSGKGTP